MRHLLLGRGQPDEVRLLQDDVEQHDALERAWHCGRTPETRLGIADGLYAVPTEGPQRGYAAQFLSVVNGAECASFEFVHDHYNLVVSIQHPGEGGTVDEPVSAWPDGTGVPRPTVIQVWKDDGGRINS